MPDQTVKASELQPGDHIKSVNGVVLRVLPVRIAQRGSQVGAAKYRRSIEVKYSPVENNDVRTGFWGSDEYLEVARGS